MKRSGCIERRAGRRLTESISGSGSPGGAPPAQLPLRVTPRAVARDAPLREVRKCRNVKRNHRQGRGVSIGQVVEWGDVRPAWEGARSMASGARRVGKGGVNGPDQ